MRNTLLYIFAVCSLSQPASARQAEGPTPVLIIDGFSNHDWAQTSRLIKWILEETGMFKVEIVTISSDTSSITTRNISFDQYKVVIQNTNNIDRQSVRWPKKTEKKLEEYVQNGGGLYVLHSANNAFPHWDAYNKMIGMGWRPKSYGYALEIDSAAHLLRIPPCSGENTGHGRRFDAVIQILTPHPINKDFPPQWKTANTEVYYFPRGPAENLKVLSYAYDSAVTHRNWPVEWIVKYGRGNVYNSSMGHLWAGEIYPPSYRCIGFQTTVIRVVEWLAHGKVTYPVPGNFPDAEKTSLKDELAYHEKFQ